MLPSAPSSLSEAEDFEREQGSSGVRFAPDIFIGRDLCPEVTGQPFGPPLVAKRKGAPPVSESASYFYTESDSTVRCVLYTWDEGEVRSLNEARKRLAQTDDEVRSALPQYEAIFGAVSQYLLPVLGHPDLRDEGTQTTQYQDRPRYDRTARWTTEGREATLRLLLTNGTQRVRLSIVWE